MFLTPNMCSEGDLAHVALVCRRVEVVREEALEAVDAVGAGQLAEPLEEEVVAVDEADVERCETHEGDPRTCLTKAHGSSPRTRQYCKMDLLS